LDESKTFNKTQVRDKNVPRSGKCKFFFLKQFYCSEIAIIIVSVLFFLKKKENCVPVNKLMLSRLSVLLKTSRAPVVISQRRPVTEEERDLALRKANEFKSKYPFTVQIMMESYVYVGFFMVMSLISHMLLRTYMELKIIPCSSLHEHSFLVADFCFLTLCRTLFL
jgi:hypothetical protein